MSDILPPLPPVVSEPHTQNYSARPEDAAISMIVIHALAEFVFWPEQLSGKPDRYIHAGEWLGAPIPGRKDISAHAYIDPLGGIHEICAEDSRAWHAGKSAWAGDVDLNRISLGVELLVSGKHDWESFVEATKTDCYRNTQYRSLGWLCAQWQDRHAAINKLRIVPHSLISPDEIRGAGKGKRDPGVGFDWDRFDHYYFQYR